MCSVMTSKSEIDCKSKLTLIMEYINKLRELEGKIYITKRPPVVSSAVLDKSDLSFSSDRTNDRWEEELKYSYV